MTLAPLQLLAILVLVSSSAVALTAWACARLHAGDSMVLRAENVLLRAELEAARKAASDWQLYHEAHEKRSVRPYRIRGSA
jgi:hypothetical protein